MRKITEKRNKAFRYRIYPNADESEMLNKTFGCVRFIYNTMLSAKIEYYNETGKMLRNTPAQYKDDYPWLKEVDSLALANAQVNLEKAYKAFFKNASTGFPQYKSKKKSKASYTTNNLNGSIRIEEGRIKLPKIGFVKIRMHREIPEGYAIKSATVTREPSGKYYVSVLTEYEAEPVARILDGENSLGLDYSSPHFYVSSEGEVADMPHWYRETEKKLAREQRKLSKMVRGGSNYEKQKKKIALLHEKMRNQRKDWQHKKSSELADRYGIICVEDINMQNMAQGLSLAKSTNDNAFGQFRSMLAYKMQERGGMLITIDKWYPSSKTCRFCGAVNTELTLRDRVWTCKCGKELNRDQNAAINIRNAGLAMLA